MCIFGKTPAIPEPQAIEAPPKLVDAEVTRARSDSKRKARAASGTGSTSRTSESPLATPKTLLGQ